MNQPQIGSFEHIPLGQIRPSTTNPRKHFDPAALEELTGSVRELGVTVPIHVRSYVDAGPGSSIERFGYEIVTGERRFRAATAAGLTEIPAIVHDGLGDEDAMDLQLVENLQRADLHPVEEAEGYRALMAHGESAEDVAKKAGKTLGYVQQRLKLLTLEVDAKKLFAEGHLTLGHALLLARLTPKDQERALRFLLSLTGDYERTPLVDAIQQRLRHHKSYTPSSRVTDRTELQLKDWIGSHVLLQLKGVPWDLGDADLLPIAGACTTCPKRTGANQALFADITTVEDTCTDSVCFSDKQKAFTRQQQELAKESGSPLLKISAKASSEKLEKPAVEIRASAVKMQGGKAVETKRAVVVATRPVKQGQWIAAKKGSCPSTVQAIAVDGPDQGKLKYVCADQACKLHPRQVTRPRPAASGGSRLQESYEVTQKRRYENVEREVPIRVALFKAVAAKLKPTADEVRKIVMDAIDSGASDGEIVCLARGWAVKVTTDRFNRHTDAGIVLQRQANLMATPDELVQLLVEMKTAEAFDVSVHRIEDKGDRDGAIAAAKSYKVDADKIIAKAEAERDAHLENVANANKQLAEAGPKTAQPAKATKKATKKKGGR